MDFPGPLFGSTHPLADEGTLMAQNGIATERMTVLTHLGIVCPGRLGKSMCTSLVSKFGSLHLPSSLFFSEHFASIVSREAFTSLLSFHSFAAAIL